MMTADEFRAALDVVGFTQVGFAKFIDVDDSTVRRWARADRPVPTSIMILLALLDKYKIAHDKARKAAGLKPVRTSDGRKSADE